MSTCAQGQFSSLFPPLFLSVSPSFSFLSLSFSFLLFPSLSGCFHQGLSGIARPFISLHLKPAFHSLPFFFLSSSLSLFPSLFSFRKFFHVSFHSVFMPVFLAAAAAAAVVVVCSPLLTWLRSFGQFTAAILALLRLSRHRHVSIQTSSEKHHFFLFCWLTTIDFVTIFSTTAPSRFIS